jgi:lipoate-protein ligase A
MTAHGATSWRLIDTGPQPGPLNMATDEALLGSFDPATSLPILRLYGWEPPTLSLGRFQKGAEALDLERCRQDNVPVVRRITGGGVIYHADELTYSIVCAPNQIPPAPSIKDSFRILTGFLLAFYRGLGLVPAYAVDMLSNGARLGERTNFCFAGRESFDILVNGDKIGGNAQRRTRGLVFQHGSIPVDDHLAQALSYLREQPDGDILHVTCLTRCGVTLERPELCSRLAGAFSDYLGVDLLDDRLTDRERSAAALLVKQKYATDRWNLEGEEE